MFQFLHDSDCGWKKVYVPISATNECLQWLQPLIDECGPIRYIVLPSVAVEHKVLAGPYVQKFPKTGSFPLGWGG